MKVTIPKPCHENWAAMTPDEKGRFCQVCSRSVRDFTSASDLQIMNDLSGDSNICGNFRVDQLDRNLSHSFINSLFAKFAVGFVLTSGGIVSAQTQAKEICEMKTDTLNIKGEISQVPTNIKDTIKIAHQIVVGKPLYNYNQNNEPLYVLDDKIITDEKFRQINSNNIEKIEVLKGAAATALYGSKGKNGAVIITLKEKPKNGKSKVR